MWDKPEGNRDDPLHASDQKRFDPHTETGGNERQFENFGGGSGDSHSQVRHRDYQKPRNDPTWLTSAPGGHTVFSSTETKNCKGVIYLYRVGQFAFTYGFDFPHCR